MRGKIVNCVIQYFWEGSGLKYTLLHFIYWVNPILSHIVFINSSIDVNKMSMEYSGVNKRVNWRHEARKMVKCDLLW